MNQTDDNNFNEIDDLDFLTEDDELDKILMDPNVRITSKDSLLLVSFILPITVERQKDGSLILSESKSMIYPTIYRLRSRGFIDYTWVGWPGIFPNDEEEKNKIIKLLEEKKCYPIWFERDELERFNVYIEKYMRPLFHNFQGTADDEFEESTSALWLTYVDVNARFVKTCVEIRKAN